MFGFITLPSPSKRPCPQGNTNILVTSWSPCYYIPLFVSDLGLKKVLFSIISHQSIPLHENSIIICCKCKCSPQHYKKQEFLDYYSKGHHNICFCLSKNINDHCSFPFLIAISNRYKNIGKIIKCLLHWI